MVTMTIGKMRKQNKYDDDDDNLIVMMYAIIDHNNRLLFDLKSRINNKKKHPKSKYLILMINDFSIISHFIIMIII